MSARLPALLLAPLAVLAACGGSGPPPATFELVRVSPDPAQGPLLLNQEITAYFSAPVDPASVTPLTFAVVDNQGRPVPGRLRTGSHSVTFQPQPPLLPSLADGSFRPDTEYRLLIAGYPRPSGLRSRGGQPLGTCGSSAFRTVRPDALPAGRATPLLPVGVGDLPFVLRPGNGWQPLSLDRPRVQLHFTLPVLPTSLSADAFELSVATDHQQIQRVVPQAVRLLMLPQPIEAFPGATVELELGVEPELADGSGRYRLREDDWLVVALRDGPTALRDYGDRPVQLLPGCTTQWWVVTARSAAVAFQWPANGSGAVLGDDGVGIEVLRDGTFRPRLRQETGDGSFGVFRPRTDTVLAVGRAFDRGDGELCRSDDGRFPFRSIEVPAGVSVTVAAAPGTVALLSCGSIRIDGTLVVPPPAESAPLRGGEQVDFNTLVAATGTLLAAAGDVRIAGRVTCEATGAGHALGIATAGDVELRGALPPGTVLAIEPGGALLGAAERLVSLVIGLTPGLAGRAPFAVAVATPWQSITGVNRAAVTWLQAGGFEVSLQTAPAGELDPAQPTADRSHWSAPRPLQHGQYVELTPGAFVRLWLRAEVHPQQTLPRGTAVQLHGL